MPDNEFISLINTNLVKNHEQDSSRKCSAWKDFRFKPLSLQYPPRDRVKCGGLVWELGDNSYYSDKLAYQSLASYKA